MSIRVFLGLIFIGTVFMVTAAGLLLLNTNPTSAGWATFSILYISLIGSSFGLLLLLGWFVRKKILRSRLPALRLKHSFRQAILFTILIIGWLAMEAKGLANWWNIGLLIIALAIIELFFMSFNRKNGYERPA